MAGRQRKYFPTTELDAVIRDVWMSSRYGKGAWRAVQKRTGCDWPRWRIARRACELGLSQKHPPDRQWTEQEDAIIRDNAWRDVGSLQRLIEKKCLKRRSLTAIHVRRRRLGAARRDSRGYFTQVSAADLLGVDVHKVSRWRQRGLLRAYLRFERCGREYYAIKPSDLRRFVIENPEQIDLRTVEKIGFVELLSGEKVDAFARMDQQAVIRECERVT